MTIDQILPLLEVYGNHSEKDTVAGAMYRNAKKGRLFTVTSPGTFGLLEWDKAVREEKA